MDRLIQLINEALVHDSSHPAFKDHPNYEDDLRLPKLDGLAAEHKTLTSLHKLPRGRVREDVKAAIENYTGEGSTEINRHLVAKHNKKRSAIWGLSDEIRDMHTTLLNHIENSAPLTQDHHVYSGLGFNPSRHFAANGGVIKTPSYMSTSIHPGVAAAFTLKGSETDQHILHFHLPAGSKHGVYLGDHSHVKEEKEFVLKPNQKWKLQKHELVEGVTPRKTFDYNSNTGRYSYVYNHNIKRHIWSVVPHDG